MAKPAAGTALNTSHALASGLLAALPMNNGTGVPVDAMGGTWTDAGSDSGSWTTNDSGEAAYVSPASHWLTSAIGNGTAFTLLLRCKVTAFQGSSGRIFVFGGSGTDTHGIALTGTTTHRSVANLGGTFQAIAGATLSLDTWYTLAAAVDGATLYRYRDGTIASQTFTGTASALASIAMGGGVTGQNPALAIDYAYAWERALSEAELDSMRDDPWQMFNSSLLLRRRRMMRCQ